jgi:hypothetical protein
VVAQANIDIIVSVSNRFQWRLTIELSGRTLAVEGRAWSAS